VAKELVMMVITMMDERLYVHTAVNLAYSALIEAVKVEKQKMYTVMALMARSNLIYIHHNWRKK
jgi:hypothetical protein